MPKPPDSALPKGASLTLIDVAKVAGVSPMTVSRALHRPELVSEKTRNKVREAVRATGYVSNMLAGGLASNKSRLVAIFLPTIANSIFADTVQALMDSLTKAGYQTMLGLTGYSAEQEEALLEAVLGRPIADFGLISAQNKNRVPMPWRTPRDSGPQAGLTP